MPSHPNRSKKNPSKARNPTPAEIWRGREAAGMTQTEAAELIHCTLRGWQDWESDAEKRRMHPAFWELWRLKRALGPEGVAKALEKFEDDVAKGAD